MTVWAIPDVFSDRIDRAIADAEAVGWSLTVDVASANRAIAVIHSALKVREAEAEAARRHVAAVIHEALEVVSVQYHEQTDAWRESDAGTAVGSWWSQWIDYADSLEGGVAVMHEPVEMTIWGLFPFDDLPARHFGAEPPAEDQPVSSADGISSGGASGFN